MYFYNQLRVSYFFFMYSNGQTLNLYECKRVIRKIAFALCIRYVTKYLFQKIKLSSTSPDPTSHKHKTKTTPLSFEASYVMYERPFLLVPSDCKQKSASEQFDSDATWNWANAQVSYSMSILPKHLHDSLKKLYNH